MIVHTGDYGKHEFRWIEVEAANDEDAAEDGDEQCWRITTSETSEMHMAGGGIETTNVLGDPYVEWATSEPTPAELHAMATMYADDLEHNLRERAREADQFGDA